MLSKPILLKNIVFIARHQISLLTAKNSMKNDFVFFHFQQYSKNFTMLLKLLLIITKVGDLLIDYILNYQQNAKNSHAFVLANCYHYNKLLFR